MGKYKVSWVSPEFPEIILMEKLTEQEDLGSDVKTHYDEEILLTVNQGEKRW